MNACSNLIKIIQVTSSLPGDDNIFITTGYRLAFMTTKTPFQTPETPQDTVSRKVTIKNFSCRKRERA